MRWLKRSVLLCLAMVVLTPAPAHAWFEWLDYLSGPGRFYGAKVDVRAYCFGKTQQESFSALTARLQEVQKNPQGPRTVNELLDIQKRIREINVGLNVVNLGTLDEHEKNLRAATLLPEAVKTEIDFTLVALRDLEKASVAIASGGIFISLCSPERRRTFAIEAGFTGLGTGGDVNYANNEKIWLTTFTAGLSYRLPLPAGRDFIDLGTNLGVYRFYSKGFDDFSGFTVEPFIDFHLPTKFLLDDQPGFTRFLARFTVRAGVSFFPAGFKAEQFASGPAKGDISGSEGTPSLTVFYNLRP
jgi:hypothetical protein